MRESCIMIDINMAKSALKASKYTPDPAVTNFYNYGQQEVCVFLFIIFWRYAMLIS